MGGDDRDGGRPAAWFRVGAPAADESYGRATGSGRYGLLHDAGRQVVDRLAPGSAPTILPVCGCDACGEAPGDLVAQLHDLVADVVDGVPAWPLRR